MSIYFLNGRFLTLSGRFFQLSGMKTKKHYLCNMKLIPHLKIKEIRKKRKYSQQYMADYLGISQMAYSKIESNKTQLNWDKLNRISKILAINIWDLVDDTKKFENGEPNNELSLDDTLDMLKKLFLRHEDEKRELLKEIQQLKKQLKK